VFGTLGTHDRAQTLLDQIESGELTSAINAYMVQEALEAFDRTPNISPSQRDELKTVFLTRLVRMTGLIEAPSSRDVSSSLLETRRSAPQIQLIAKIIEIQPKDVPILVLAAKHSEREPTNLTNDEAFAAFSPSHHNLPSISIKHIG
jgi:predicted nucleic acid-binding protein